MRSSIVFGALSVLTIVGLGVGSGCSSGGACDPLDLENPCPAGNGFARFCSVPDLNTCVNVCQGANLLGGDSCEFDLNCDADLGLTCDNDRVAVSTCECVLACPSVGAAEGSVQAGGSCSQSVDCAADLACDNEQVGISSCTCVTTQPADRIPGCEEPDPAGGPGSVPPSGPCDQDSDCQAESCRDPATNEDEGCTCRNLDGGGGDCDTCVGTNAAPEGAPSNRATSCEDAGNFECSCQTELGETRTFYMSSAECFP